MASEIILSGYNVWVMLLVFFLMGFALGMSYTAFLLLKKCDIKLKSEVKEDGE
jgi:hypothetical protein